MRFPPLLLIAMTCLSLGLGGCALLEHAPEKKPVALAPAPRDPGAAPWKPTLSAATAIRAGAAWAATSPEEHVVAPQRPPSRHQPTTTVTGRRPVGAPVSLTVVQLARSITGLPPVEARTMGVYAGTPSSTTAWSRYCDDGQGMTASDWQIVSTEGGPSHTPPAPFQASCRPPR